VLFAWELAENQTVLARSAPFVSPPLEETLRPTRLALTVNIIENGVANSLNFHIVLHSCLEQRAMCPTDSLLDDLLIQGRILPFPALVSGGDITLNVSVIWLLVFPKRLKYTG
jgi:hypothetical protein